MIAAYSLLTFAGIFFLVNLLKANLLLPLNKLWMCFELLLGKIVSPIVLNTSFNVRGEPIICKPTDAFKCFMGSNLDILAIGNYLLMKNQQDESLKENYEEHYDLD